MKKPKFYIPALREYRNEITEPRYNSITVKDAPHNKDQKAYLVYPLIWDRVREFHGKTLTDYRYDYASEFYIVV